MSSATKREPYVMAGDVYAPAAARRPRRMELVHGIGGVDVSGGRSKAYWGCGDAAQLQHRSLHPFVVARLRDRVACRDTRYVISVSNPERRCRGVAESSVDGVGMNPDAIPLVLDGGTHQVRIRLGTVSESVRAPAFPEPAAAGLPVGTTRM